MPGKNDDFLKWPFKGTIVLTRLKMVGISVKSCDHLIMLYLMSLVVLEMRKAGDIQNLFDYWKSRALLLIGILSH